MATITLRVGEFWATGTNVAAYPASNWPASALPPTGAPPGSSTDTDTVSSAGLVTFDGVTEGADYYAYASSQYVHFKVDGEKGTSGDPVVSSVSGTVLVEPTTAGAPTTQSAVSTSTTTADALAANSAATYRQFTNTSTSIGITLKLATGAATDYAGIYLGPGASWDGLVSGKLYKGIVRAKSVSGTPTLAVVEG